MYWQRKIWAVTTCWFGQVRKEVNKLDNMTTGKAVDALLNYETVKLFNNEQLEACAPQVCRCTCVLCPALPDKPHICAADNMTSCAVSHKSGCR